MLCVCILDKARKKHLVEGIALYGIVVLCLLAAASCGRRTEQEHAEFVEIAEGAFLMGPSNYGDQQHRVVITNKYYIGKREVTAKSYATFLQDVSKSVRADKFVALGEKCPLVDGPSGFQVRDGMEHSAMQGITYAGALAYCQWLAGKDGVAYRLPTEAEWEFAVKSSQQLDGAARNPWEWCSDWYGAYTDGPVTNPAGPAHPQSLGYQKKVIRGGSWVSAGSGFGFDSPAKRAEATSRASATLDGGFHRDVGLRLLAEVTPPLSDRSDPPTPSTRGSSGSALENGVYKGK